MDLQTMTYIVVGLTFALYIGIAFWARAGTTKDSYSEPEQASGANSSTFSTVSSVFSGGFCRLSTTSVRPLPTR